MRLKALKKGKVKRIADFFKKRPWRAFSRDCARLATVVQLTRLPSRWFSLSPYGGRHILVGLGSPTGTNA
jgi:hypothetical protein